MITPDPRDDTSKKRRFAALMTAAVVGLAGALVAFVSVPEFQNPRDSFKEIDPARLTQVRPQPESNKPKEEPQEEQQEEQQETKETPERIEAPELKTDALQADPSPSQTTPSSPSESNASSDANNGGVDVERTQVGGLQGDNASASSGAGALPSTTTDPSADPEGGGGGGISVAEAGGGNSGGDGEGEFAGGETVAAGSEEAGTEGKGEAVAVQQAQQEDYKASVEANKLIQWMKEHPAPLPPGIERLVGYQPNYLSSKIQELNTSEGTYEMYLMCKQSLREIHIVLVRGGEAKYLVDRSFQKQSRKFRVGPVRRSGGEIIGVQTQAQSRGKESKEFYSVFLSWWQKAKTDV